MVMGSVSVPMQRASSSNGGDGTVNERLKEFVSDLTHVHTWSPSGKFIHAIPFDDFTGEKGYLIHKGSLIHVMYEHAQSLGINIRHNCSVTDHWETKQQAGVVANGERIAVDCVICAEGIHSRGRSIITKHDFEESPLGPIFSSFWGTTLLVQRSCVEILGPDGSLIAEVELQEMYTKFGRLLARIWATLLHNKG